MSYSKKSLSSCLTVILILALPHTLFSSIVQGTLVKTPTGFTRIEQLSVGDIVFSYDGDHLIKNRITHIASTKIHPSYKVSTQETSFYASAHQLIFDSNLQNWITIESLDAESQIVSLTSGNQPCSVSPFEEIPGYDLSLEAPHNFLITEQEILVHNIAPAIVLAPLVATEGAVIAKGITCGIALLGEHLLHKRLARKQLQQQSNPAPNSSSPIDPNDPEWKKKHPHGKYEDAPYHHTKSRGKKSPAPKDGQDALDHSVQISNGSPRRIGVSEGEIVVLTRHGEQLFHGHVRQWNELRSDMKAALEEAKLVNHKGKIL